jgi:hypothetical protein
MLIAVPSILPALSGDGDASLDAELAARVASGRDCGSGPARKR